MEHFYQTIPGWCDYADLYAAVVQALPDGAHVVEVGCWQGQSTAALAVEIANSGKAIRLDVVDWFQGSPDEGPTGALPLPDLRERFEAHVAPVRPYIRDIHAMRSTEAAALYPPHSLDFVWLDASHQAPDVLADLMAWWPKVKPTGILAGHDLDWASVQTALQPWAEWAGVSIAPMSQRSWLVQKPAAVNLWSPPPGERTCLVAVASNERTIYRQTVESLIRLGWGARVTQAAEAHGFREIAFEWLSRHTRVDDLRNDGVAVARGLKMSHLLFLDADMTWPADVLSRMLRHHDRGIVSGVYHLKAWPHWPVAFQSGTVNLQTREVDYTYDEQAGTGTDLREQALVGMGCALIPMALCEAMPAPWFEYRQNRYGQWTITEDVAFCQKASAHGCPIWVDPTVKCGHVGGEPVTEPFFHRAMVESKAMDDLAKAAGKRSPLVAV